MDNIINIKHENYKRESIQQLGGASFENPQAIKNIYFSEESGQPDLSEEILAREREEKKTLLQKQLDPVVGMDQSEESKAKELYSDFEEVMKNGGSVFRNDKGGSLKPKVAVKAADDEEEGQSNWGTNLVEMKERPKRRKKGGRK